MKLNDEKNKKKVKSPKAEKPPKAPKAPKAEKPPKAPKAPKAEKPPKAPKAPKADKPSKAPNDKKPAGKAKILIIIAIVVVALVLASAAAGVIYVSTIDNIYPNVTLDGINLSNMSLTEAMALLSEKGYSSLEGKEVNVLMPLDIVLNVKSEDVCSITGVAEHVQRVYDGCKGGNPIAAALNYVRCCFVGMSFESETVITADEEAVAAAVDNVVREVKLALLSSEVQIGEETILVLKGAKGITIDGEAIAALVIDALENEKYEDIIYDAKIDTDQELDIDKLHESVFLEPEDARYDKKEGKTVEHIVGIDFDKEEAVKLWNAAEYGETVEIPIIFSDPEITTDKFNELLFRDVLSECTTSLWGSSYNRVNNVRKAVDSVNGVILLPGEEFDYNTTLGKRTPENGYLMAGAYSSGQTVQEYGGGICQISSMTYYCALYANLKISSRTCHYFTVAYLPLGLDATVSWGGPEFRFINNRDFPIKIEASVSDDNKSVEMKIIGSDIDGSYVKMAVGSWEVFDEEYEEVAIGLKAASTRYVYNADGTLRSSNWEASSYYHYHEEDIEWPSPSPSESPSPSPSPSASPSPTPTPSPSTEPTPTPSTEPTSTPTSTPTPSTEPTPTPTPPPAPEPPPEPSEPVE